MTDELAPNMRAKQCGRGAAMTAQDNGGRGGNLAGMALMTLAMQIVPFSDAAAKILGGEHGYPPSQIAWWRVAFSALFLLPFGMRALPSFQNGAAMWRATLPHWPRGACWAGATWFFFAAIQHNPLPSSLALLFVAPLFVAVCAPLFLPEKFSRRSVAAAAFGFVGALIILRPTAEDFSPTLALALLAGLCYGGYLMLTRRAGLRAGGGQTALMTMLAAAVLLAPFVDWQWPEKEHWPLILMMGALSALGHWLIAQSCRRADISKLAPLNYSEMLAAALISVWIFNEVPNATAAIGIAMIVAAGIFTARGGGKKT